MSDYELYLEKFCNMYGVSKEEASKNVLVKEVHEMYEAEETREKNTN